MLCERFKQNFLNLTVKKWPDTYKGAYTNGEKLTLVNLLDCL